ncbi:adenine phosphoribosyltransferase [Colletotrichum asianum]|uniref:adenine phosphoribosyltransferase n=1 Tax=Colletotrichum asianum TaxID=702518 RepID=A0A8H3W595_9PEZI|nr:adenine phosphoribosyltransferase [Colletotrichum asianum]
MEEKKQADDAVIRGLRSLGVDLTDDIVQKAASTFKGMMPMDRFRAEYLGDCSPEGLSVKASTDVEIATTNAYTRKLYYLMEVVFGAPDVDVLFITGKRDEAPVADFSHLVPESKLVDIRVNASKDIRWRRRGVSNGVKICNGTTDHHGESATSDAEYSPSMEFHNNVEGNEALTEFASKQLLPLAHDDSKKLADMIRDIPGFRAGIDFRHAVDIAKRPGGLVLCMPLLRSHFLGDWSKVDAIVCCETGGFIFASALAMQLGKPLVPIREAGKLPPPVVSVARCASQISSGANGVHERRIQMDRDVLPREASLRSRGFGRVNVQSLLVFGSV